MNKLLKAKIFLADERGCNETEWYRTLSTFNFLGYINEHKHSFADIYTCNDNTLAGGRCYSRNIPVNSVVLLLPVVGTVSYNSTYGNESLVTAGQLHVSFHGKGSSFEMSNPDKEPLINFLEIWLRADFLHRPIEPVLLDFDLHKHPNTLLALDCSISENNYSDLTPLVSIGKFDGRNEAIYQLKNKQSTLFVFVIEGVFEVQGRLLHSKDGLGLWNEAGEIELEALSDGAIVLLVECTKNDFLTSL